MTRGSQLGRARLAMAAAVVLVSGCTASGEPQSVSSSSGRPASTNSSDFCAGGQDLILRFESASTSVDQDFRQEVFREVVAGSRNLVPPAEVASDWAVLTEEMDGLAQTWSETNLRDPAQAAAAERLEDQMSASFIKWKGYLLSQCGIDSSAPGRQIVFAGDFETGDFSQWSQCQTRVFSGSCKDMPADFYGMQIVDSGVRQGQYAARFELREGDNPAWGGGERTEVARYKEGTVREGEERWYEFSLMFDAAFPAENDKYFMVMQWHGANHLPPPMGIEVQGDGQLLLTSHFPPGPSMLIGDIARGEWVDYVVGAKFSQDANIGWAEVYRNGVLTIPRHARATMNSDYDFLKMGLYRDGKGSKPTAVMLADRFRVSAP